MIKIRELLKIDLFKEMTLLGKNICYDNEIDSIGILDYEAVENKFSLFRKGDIVLTTLMFARDKPELAEEALIKLMRQRVSAIAIKDIYYDDVSENVQIYADKYHIQLMVFNDLSFEDIIVSVSDEIRKKEVAKYFEVRVDELMRVDKTKQHVIEKLNEINSSFLNASICAFCTPIGKSHENNQKLIAKIMNKVRSRKTKGINSIHNTIFTYKNGLFIMHTYSNCDNEENYLNDIFECIGLDKDLFKIGVSQNKVVLSDLVYGISEAIAANAYQSSAKGKYIHFTSMGLDQLLLPLIKSNWLITYSEDLLGKIKEHDQHAKLQLYPTVVEYVKNKGELKKTSMVIGQHVNTIRNRLNKVKDIIGYNEYNNDFYEQIYMAVRIELLQKNCKKK